jgi:membrane fusion protein (multidrug efflux system)
MYKNRLLSENELRQYQLIFHEDEINLTQAQITLDRSVIKAPFAGTITEREIVAGDKVNPSRPLFALVDGSSMKLDVWVNEDVARIMKVGMIGMVMPFSSISLDTVEAVLVRVNPVIDPQYGKRKATFKIKGESTMLKPGQFVDINLSLLTHSDVLIIPKRAIVHQAGSAVVFVCNDSVAVRKVVQTDLETGDDIEITHGIDLGDFIIVEGQSTLKDSTVVNVITPEL